MVSFIRYRTLFKFYEFLQPVLKYSPPLEDDLPARRAMVIAPHPDDEVIGCGGAIKRMCASGGTAAILYCTSDGEPRDSEAKKAASLLGITDARSLGFPVESLSGQAEFPGKLAAAVNEFDPEILFVPFALDNHVDHRAVNTALARAAKDITAQCLVYAYPVWFPVYPNVLVDISDAWEAKEKAIRCYASQMATRDYVTMARSLAAYWGEVKGRKGGLVESFYRATLPEYAKLIGKVLG